MANLICCFATTALATPPTPPGKLIFAAETVAGRIDQGQVVIPVLVTLEQFVPGATLVATIRPVGTLQGAARDRVALRQAVESARGEA